MKLRIIFTLLMAFAAYAFAAMAQGQQPDLVVAAVTAAGDRSGAIITANIRNDGAGPSPRAVVTLYNRETRETENAVVRDLAPGADASVSFQMRVALTASIQVMVDSDRRIAESNEGNNRTLNTPVGSLLASAPPPRDRTFPPRNAGTSPLTVDKRMTGSLRRLQLGRRSDGTQLVAAGLTSPRGLMTPFIEDELVLVTQDAGKAAAFAAEFGGRIDSQSRKTASGRTIIKVRLNPDIPTSYDFATAGKGFSVSSERAANLLAMAARAREMGLRPSLNFVLRSSNIILGHTTEGDGLDAATFKYNRDSAPYFVDVVGAWKVLEAAKRTRQHGVTVPVLVLDRGFASADKDLPPYKSDNPGTPNIQEPSKPWHGTHVAEAMGSNFDDGLGGAGSGTQIVEMNMRTMAIDFFNLTESIANLGSTAFSFGSPFIVNMSFGASISTEGIGGWFSDSGVEVLDQLTESLANSNILLFAAAGNDGDNVDWRTENGKGPEGTAVIPCESKGVICVGGFESAFPGNPGGTADIAKGSNRGDGLGETVDIYGPYNMVLGDDPNDDTVAPVISGTSFASPFVAGIAAMIKAANPNLTAPQVWNLMNKHAKNIADMKVVHAFGPVREAVMMQGKNIAPVIAKLTATKAVNGQYGTISANSIVFDVEDSPSKLKYTWLIDNQQILVNNGALLNYPAKGLSAGTHKLALSISDSGGASMSSQVEFNVTASKPTIEFIKPGPSSTGTHFAKVDLGAYYEFKIAVTDGLALPSVQACTQVVWTLKDDKGGVTYPTPKPNGCSLLVNFPNPGYFRLYAKFTDAYGQVAQAEALIYALKATTAGSVPKITFISDTSNMNFDSNQSIKVAYQIQGDKPESKYERKWSLRKVITGETRTKYLPNLPDTSNPSVRVVYFTIKHFFPEADNYYGTSNVPYELILVVKDKETGQESAPATLPIVLRGMIK